MPTIHVVYDPENCISFGFNPDRRKALAARGVCAIEMTVSEIPQDGIFDLTVDLANMLLQHIVKQRSTTTEEDKPNG